MNSSPSMIAYALPLLVVLGTSLILPKIEAHDYPIDYLQPHNAAREQVGLGPLTWDETLVSYAQNYIQQLTGNCELVHSHGPYGENLAASTAGYDMPAADAVKMWVDERQWYDYQTNSCVPGQMCGHYTQVVWRNSVRVGCAKAFCDNGGTVTSCNYEPPGNYVGEWPF